MKNRLRELRLEHNLRQIDVAKKIGVSQQSYGFYENWVNKPDPETLEKLANLYNVSIDYLLGITDDFTVAERAAGASATRHAVITPIEDEMLYTFRQIGKRFGEQAQHNYITVGENMLKLK